MIALLSLAPGWLAAPRPPGAAAGGLSSASAPAGGHEGRFGATAQLNLSSAQPA